MLEDRYFDLDLFGVWKFHQKINIPQSLGT
jgi:hypothetical protein